MQLANKPFKVHPYDEMHEFGAPWIDELTSNVEMVISGYKEAIRLEAEHDGEPKLADEEYLYERFKDNCNYGLMKANWQVLKYFYQYFRMKIFYDMIGKWCFTDRDAEMYDYFIHVVVNDIDKCKPSNLRFNVKPELLVSCYDESCGFKWQAYTFQYDYSYQFSDRPNRATGYYLNLFNSEFGKAEYMLRKAKKLTLDDSFDTSFFTCNKLHGDYTELPHRAIDVIEPYPEDLTREFFKYCSTNVKLCDAIDCYLNAENNLKTLFDEAYNSFKHEYKNKLDEPVIIKKQLLDLIRYYNNYGVSNETST